MSRTTLALLTLATALACYALTASALRILTARAVLDRPNERSSHAVPTPRGAGLAVVAALVPALMLVAGLQGEIGRLAPVLIGIAALAALSFLDDIRGLAPGIRFLAQAVAVAGGILALPEETVTQGWLPFWLDRALVGIAWLWFLNLFNFMDGIDGITAVETIAIGAGVALVASCVPVPGWLGAFGLILTAAALGFLPWNWHPAKIFLGDVGSVPLGYLAGFLLLSLAAQGLWTAALALPLYYLVDATVTLLKRLFRGERIWEAHRQHWYQKAASGSRHDRVSLRIALANGALIGIALASACLSPAVVVLAPLVVLALIGELARLARATAPVRP